MKNLFLVFAAIIAITTIVFGYTVLPHSELVIIKSGELEVRILYFALYSIVFISGLFTGALIVGRYAVEATAKHGKIKRHLEKTAIGADDSDLRVKTLENKVKTLESALDKAMENNQKEE